jgi:hypothetical protein
MPLWGLKVTEVIAYIRAVKGCRLTLCYLHFCVHHTSSSEQTEIYSLVELQKDILRHVLNHINPSGNSKNCGVWKLQLLIFPKDSNYLFCIVLGTKTITSLININWFYIDKIQQVATICKYLFTANILYKLRVSITPVISST